MRESSIPLYRPHVPQAASAALDEVLQSGQIAGDGNLPEFETKLREFLGVSHLVLTAEFSRSIEMALRMAGVGPGDLVLTSPLACLATTMPILQTGARPVWCDVDAETGNLNPDEIARRRAGRAKAILLYHWVGVPADVSKVQYAAEEAGLKVVEDVGEALGAEYKSRRLGALGSDYSVFSFSPVRHITTGEGAAITFREENQCELARLWRRYGISAPEFRDSMGEIRSECDISIPGFHNYMSRLSGALGRLQMEYLPGIVNAHRSNGLFFEEALAGVSGVRLLKKIEGSVPSYWVYCFLCERRDDLLTKLRGARIHASKVHARNDSYSCFETGPADLPGVFEFERNQISVPCGWWVTDEDRQYIAETIRGGW
jgi:dTDP-4-amino-4,6-dideoxygalactose transaminase